MLTMLTISTMLTMITMLTLTYLANTLPELSSYLVSTLSHLYVNDLSHLTPTLQLLLNLAIREIFLRALQLSEFRGELWWSSSDEWRMACFISTWWIFWYWLRCIGKQWLPWLLSKVYRKTVHQRAHCLVSWELCRRTWPILFKANTLHVLWVRYRGDSIDFFQNDHQFNNAMRKPWNIVLTHSLLIDNIIYWNYYVHCKFAVGRVGTIKNVSKASRWTVNVVTKSIRTINTNAAVCIQWTNNGLLF